MLKYSSSKIWYDSLSAAVQAETVAYELLTFVCVSVSVTHGYLYIYFIYLMFENKLAVQ